MKRIGVAIACVLLILAFKSQNVTHNHKQAAVIDSGGALNGYSESQANSLVTYCYGTVDNSPVNTQVWFSRKVIEHWYDLLQADSITKKINSDGIRFYITRRLLSDSNKKHYNNAIVVVSTFYAGDTVKKGVITFKHQDYFDHVNIASPLDKKELQGCVTHYSDSTQGALLYNTCNCDIKTPCIIASDHTIPRSQAEQMVQHFRRIIIFRNGSINSRAEWFDKGMFKHLINEWKGDTSIDGVRIYFSRGMKKYSTVTPDSTIGKSKFVMVTTRHYKIPNTNNYIHKDYFDCTHGIETGQLMETKRKKGKTGGVYDDGELCPTNCTGATLPNQ